jgi:hypothetical protein
MPSVPTALGRAAAGLGHRPEIAGDLLAAPDVVDFVEVVAEACFASPAAQREAVAVSRVWPAVLHGVKLSLGSAEGIDPDRARRLGALARELRAPAVTEHVAFVRAGGREIGHLTQVPLTREMVEVVARNVVEARRALPDVPFHLENPAWTFRWPGDEMDEASFFGEIAERTGCDLLLDLGNLYANAVNAGADPEAALRAFPLDRVAMVHVAGGVREDGFYFDTHAHPVPGAVLDLLARLVERVGPVPVVLERDDAFPPFADLAAEVAHARRIVQEAHSVSSARAKEASGPGRGEEQGGNTELVAAQAEVARMLTDPEAPSPDAARPFGQEAIARSREVLRRKRVDDALPLLQRLVPYREVVRPLALSCLEGTPRANGMAGVADALRIAAAAGEGGGIADPRIAAEARVDLLLLRSRFVGPAKDGSLRPRAAPFVGRERLPGGRVVWVVKGPGGGADVRIFETRR